MGTKWDKVKEAAKTAGKAVVTALETTHKGVETAIVAVDTICTGLEVSAFGRPVDDIVGDAAAKAGNKTKDVLSGPATVVKKAVVVAACATGRGFKNAGGKIADEVAVINLKGEMAKKRRK